MSVATKTTEPDEKSVKERLDDGTYVFTRESLCDERVMQYVYDLVEEGWNVDPNPLNVQALIQNYPSDGTVLLAEIATALDYHGLYSCPSELYSIRVEHDCHRYAEGH